MSRAELVRRACAELIGSAALLAIVVGSGIMAERLAGGNVALALLANALATGAGLVALILTFADLSGAHFNPAVSLASALRGELSWRELPGYVLAQITGALIGVLTAHAMFELPLLQASRHVRTGPGQWLSELVATSGLLACIFGVSRSRPQSVPFAVGLYITAAYWFTSSTSFANPAVTLARATTDTFAGIRPDDAPAFIGVQLIATLATVASFRWLLPTARLPR